MKVSNAGRVIFTTPSTISYDPSLTPQEQQIVSHLAPLIYKSGRNWLPVYVIEEDLQEYSLVGSPVVLEACKEAEQDIIHCILLDDEETTQQQIENGEKFIFQSLKDDLPSTGITVLDEQKIQSIQNTLVGQLEVFTRLSKQLMPSETLYINVLSKKELIQKLECVSGIGDKTAPQIAKDILNHRPFDSDIKLFGQVGKFHRKKDKSPSKLFKAFKETYQLSWASEQSASETVDWRTIGTSSIGSNQDNHSLTDIETLLNQQQQILWVMQQHFITPHILKINQESEKELRLLCQQVKGIGSMQIERMVKIIVEKRPFSSIYHVRDALQKLETSLNLLNDYYDIDFTELVTVPGV